MNDQPTTERTAPRDATSRLEEQLVAYLDGELSAAEAQQVERRLAQDPAIQDQLKSLGRAWEALDELPPGGTTSAFTSETLEMVSVAASGEIETFRQMAPKRRRRHWSVLGLIALVGALLGFSAARQTGSDPDEQILRDLPVIQNLDSYLHAGDIEFLRRLNDEGLFQQAHDDDV